MNYREVRTAVKKKMLKEQELMRQKVLKAEAEKREQKERYEKWATERAAVATEKRGRMQQLQQEKATKEERERKLNEQLKQQADKERRERANVLKENWMRRERTKRIEKLKREAEMKVAHLKLNALAMQRREETKRQMKLWLEKKNQQEALNRANFNLQVQQSKIAREAILSQRQERLATLILSKVTTKVKPKSKNSKGKRGNVDKKSGAVSLALPPLGFTDAC